MSTLTPEQRAAICGGIGKDWDEVLVRDVNAFRAGMRYQHERTREAAAKVCESVAQRFDVGYARNDHVAVPQDGCDKSAAAIRALTLDEC